MMALDGRSRKHSLLIRRQPMNANFARGSHLNLVRGWVKNLIPLTAVVMIRAFVGLTLCITVIFSAGVNINAAELNTSAKEGIDAILLIDTSGSMRFSDTERTALEAAQLFIDMMETRNSRIGIIAFTDELQAVIPLTSISDPAVKEQTKKTVADLIYNGYTDIGMSLKEAVAMLMADMRDTNSPMIALLTDGVIEIKPGQNTRTAEASHAEVLEALDYLNNKAPVYTIGLNHNDSVDVDLLTMISSRTLARTYIAEQASDLPLIFNEIFADHIRSSLTEVASFVTDGDQYTDVPVDIHSAFVAEANIIMLSSKPLTDIKITDPSGGLVTFDGVNYTLSRSNRYTMVKLVSPAEGDWTLSVKGLPDDSVTVNLIYSYNVDIAISVGQNDSAGPLYNPAQPITVTAAFISANTANAHLELYNETTATLCIYDKNIQLLKTLPMNNNGSTFTAEYLSETAQDVHLTVQVTHTDFKKTSAYVTVLYAQPEAAVPAATPEPTAAPEPTPSPAPTPTPTPAAEPGLTPTAAPDKSSPVTYVLIAAVLLAVLAAAVLVLRKRSVTKLFNGYLEVRALMENGLYTSLEAPDLSTFAGHITLLEFLNTTLSAKGARILQNPVEIRDINLTPGLYNGRPVIVLESKGHCRITDDENNVLTQNKIFWQDNQRLTFSNEGSEARLEITYRANGE